MNEHKYAIAAGVFAIILAGGGVYHCARNTISCVETCKYDDRRFEPAHTYTWTRMQCVAYNTKSGVCSIQIPVDETEHVPDRWFIQWRDAKGGTERESVSQELFNNPPASVTHTHTRWKVCP